MDEVTKENYLKELFIDEVKGCLSDSSVNGKTIYNLGTYGNLFKMSDAVNVKTMIENGQLPSNIDYTKLTKDDFIVGACGEPAGQLQGTMNVTTTGQMTAQIRSKREISHAYNASTGVLTINNLRANIVLTIGSTNVGTVQFGQSCRAYLLV